MDQWRLTDYDLYLLAQGNHYKSYEKLGAHLVEREGVAGTYFAVWAPNAHEISVIGDWNAWRHGADPMDPCKNGFWECFIPGVGRGAIYKYSVHSNYQGYRAEKADPYAFATELMPNSASKVWDLEYEWSDDDWMQHRAEKQSLDKPMAIYEVHLGAWRRGENNQFLGYREIAPLLAAYLKEMNYTHVELLPVTEHPFYGSWGYQTLAYYAPTSRYGTPQDLMFLIDTLHQNGIGVLIDWVPAHFPTDGHGLGFFDGTHLYEHADPRKGFHADWGTFIFNYGRNEVRNFLISNAVFWPEVYHADGLRVDAVASMLYLDYGRKEAGAWVPNQYGGRENLEAVDFIRHFNDVVHTSHPGVLTIAEESTSWPMVSRPPYLGGLGFNLKWNMGWMHDVLDYISKDPVFRQYHHNNLTFGLMYAFSENFILPFSHDEVVHLKKAMLSKMPGDYWQQFANLRLLYGFMTGHPGKKLLFMGSELGQWKEWNHDEEIDWGLLSYSSHQGLRKWVSDLNRFYVARPELHEMDFEHQGFQWIDCNDYERSIISFLRFGKDPDRAVAFVCNFTPVPRWGYRIGVPWGGNWKEELNSDAEVYFGSGLGNLGGLTAEEVPFHGRPYSLSLTLPPLATVIFSSARSATMVEDKEEELHGDEGLEADGQPDVAG